MILKKEEGAPTAVFWTDVGFNFANEDGSRRFDLSKQKNLGRKFYKLKGYTAPIIGPKEMAYWED